MCPLYFLLFVILRARLMVLCFACVSVYERRTVLGMTLVLRRFAPTTLIDALSFRLHFQSSMFGETLFALVACVFILFHGMLALERVSFRTLPVARRTTAVPHSELALVKETAEVDVLCFDCEERMPVRIRWTSEPRMRLTPLGLIGECHVVAAAGRKKSLEDSYSLRIHFCAHIPCRGKFNSTQAPTPSFHVVALSLVEQAYECDVEALAGSTIVDFISESQRAEMSMMALAEGWNKPFAFVGPFAFAAFAYLRRRPLHLYIGNEFMSIHERLPPDLLSHIDVNRPPLEGACVIVERVEGAGDNVRRVRPISAASEMHLVNHYMPLLRLPCEVTPAPRQQEATHPTCDGSRCSKLGDPCMVELRAYYRPLGLVPLVSLSDGRCAFDTMLAWDGRAKDALQLKLIRNEICCHIVNASRDKIWHSACVAFGEVDGPSPTTSIAVPLVGSSAVDSAANIASSAIVGTVVGHALGEEGVAGSLAQSTRPLEERGLGTGSTATADEDATAELDNAIAWSTSLTTPNRPDMEKIKRLLSPEEQANLIMKWTASQLQEKANKEAVYRKPRRDATLQQKKKDCIRVNEFARARGINLVAAEEPRFFSEAFHEGRGDYADCRIEVVLEASRRPS
jgi:hypothetical protein